MKIMAFISDSGYISPYRSFCSLWPACWVRVVCGLRNAHVAEIPKSQPVRPCQGYSQTRFQANIIPETCWCLRGLGEWICVMISRVSPYYGTYVLPPIPRHPRPYTSKALVVPTCFSSPSLPLKYPKPQTPNTSKPTPSTQRGNAGARLPAATLVSKAPQILSSMV